MLQVYILAGSVAATALITGYTTWSYMDTTCENEIARLERAAEDAARKARETQRTVEYVYITKEVEREKRSAALDKEVDRYVTDDAARGGDPRCLDDDWLRVYDAVSAGEAKPGAAEVTAGLPGARSGAAAENLGTAPSEGGERRF